MPVEQQMQPNEVSEFEKFYIMHKNCIQNHIGKALFNILSHVYNMYWRY